MALDLKWQVIAPLPLPVEMYRADFKDEALREFNDLLQKCPHFFIGWAPGCNAENTREYGHFRDLQYAFVGEYLTRHCEVLVAFWDGLPVKGIGGTGDVVATQMTGIPVDLMELRRDGALLDAPEGGRVIQIKTPRVRHKDAGISGITIGVVEPPDGSDAAASKTDKKVIQQRLEEQRKKRRTQWQAFVAAANDTLAKDAYGALPPRTADDSPVLNQTRDSFLRADALAGARQKAVERLFHLILSAAGVFIVLIAVAGAFEPGRITEFSLVLSWVFLALAWGISRHPKTVELQKQRQDYRALAEAWRVCFFWRLVGIPTEIATAYLRYQRGELDWTRQAFNAHDLKTRPMGEKRSATPQDFQHAYEEWVKGQSEYFLHPTKPDKGKVPGLRKKLTRCRDRSWFLLFVGLCAAAVGTVADLTTRNAFSSPPPWGDAWLFARNFLSADRLASPFTPALLLLARMDSWKLVTEENTQASPSSSPEEEKRLRRLHRWILRRNTRQRALFIGVFVLALALACEFAPGISVAISLRPWLQVIETACFFAPALFFLYADINAFPEHVESYERMAGIFERAQQMLEQMAGIPTGTAGSDNNWADEKTQENARRILHELGREALHENGEWLLIHRDRPLDIEA